MNTEYLRYFLAVVEYGSINKAAEQLYITQPGLRNALSSLEKDLGIPLIEKTKKGSRPTEMGKIVAKEAPVLLEYIDRWHALASTLKGNKNTLHILSNKPFCDIVLSPILAHLHTQFGTTKVAIENADTETILSAIRREECDIGISYIFPDKIEYVRKQLPSEKWELTEVYRDRIMVYFSKLNEKSELSQISREDMQNFSMIQLARGEFLPCTFTDDLYSSFPSNIQLDSYISIFNLIQVDVHYATFLSSLLSASEILKGQICARPYNTTVSQPSFYLIYRKESFRTTIEQLLISSIKNYCHQIQ